ncbi:hypothetical protein ABMA27_006481 [Loxostege sticticalis]|uniref:THAP-type domain-containing protein n=1 Tax=Loxostege sticticalis TaxID=481309 RepID=A0ABR3IJB2_LOXSC
MPSCVVKWCKNNTTSQKKCQGITFHRFPTGNEPWKYDWTRIIRNCRGQEDWSASKNSVVCSIHFDQNDLYTTSKGTRRLVTYATRIKLFMVQKQHIFTMYYTNFKVTMIVPNCLYVKDLISKTSFNIELSSTLQPYNYNKPDNNNKISDTFICFCKNFLNILITPLSRSTNMINGGSKSANDTPIKIKSK